MILVMGPFQGLGAGDHGASFLEIGVGARALGMGGTFAGFADDGTAFYWNPAGLAWIQKITISGMYGPQFGTLKNPLGNYHFIGIAQPLPGNAVLSVNWIRFAVDDIPVYSDLGDHTTWDRIHDRSLRPSGEPEGWIQDIEDAVFFSFAKMNRFVLDLGWQYHSMGVEMPFGINLKWIRQNLGSGEASGLGLDAGLMLRLNLAEFFEFKKLGWIGWGVHFQDATGTRLSWNTKHQDRVPMNVKWGISVLQPIFARHSVRISYDRDSRWGGKNRFGLEYQGFDILGLRLGVDEGRLTAGAGLSYRGVQVEYAWLSHELNSLHRVSCSFRFK